MKYNFSVFVDSKSLAKSELESIHRDWFRCYKKENRNQPFKVLHCMNKVIDHFLMAEDSQVAYLQSDKSPSVGWINVRKVDDKKVAHINYLYLSPDVYLGDDFISHKDDLRIFKEGKVYTVFWNSHLEMIYGKDLVYFPWYWVLLEKEQGS